MGRVSKTRLNNFDSGSIVVVNLKGKENNYITELSGD